MLAVQPSCVYEVGRPSTAAAERPSFPLPTPGIPVPPSMIEDLSTRLGNLKYGHGHLVKKVIQVSDAEVAAGVTIREIGPRVFAIDGQIQALHAAVQQRDTQIQQLQTTVTEMSSRESTMMHIILETSRFLTWVEAEWLVSRLKMRNGEDFSYIGSMFPLMYQLMAVKKTSFPEMEYSGSVVASIPDVVEDQNKALSDT
ncbi:hypothetical protein Tco_0909572 [Tanacetum coccineum]|uniref:Uncharacterized protein n=1 Tax=Tanacetum coccineum TaxID=301880 RepID=A0ABQ5CT66_9ASTR